MQQLLHLLAQMILIVNVHAYHAFLLVLYNDSSKKSLQNVMLTKYLKEIS